MSRPSENLDDKMIKAGIQIVLNEGSEALSVRNICDKAKVNLGMFNYYF